MNRHHHSRFTAFLLGELPRLVRAGVLDEAAAERLRNYYRVTAVSPVGSRLTLFLSILSALLIGGGLIMVVAHNWDQFSFGMRLFTALAPLVLALGGGVAVLARQREKTLGDVMALLIAASGASALAIISQLYHTTGTLAEFLTVVLFLSAPLLYFLRSNALAAVYALALPVVAFSGYSSDFSSYCTAFLAALVLPYICRVMFCAATSAAAQLLRVVFIILAITVVGAAVRQCEAIPASFVWMVLALGFYLGGLLNRHLGRFNILLYAGGGGMLIFLVAASFSGFWRYRSDDMLWWTTLDSPVEYLTVGIAVVVYLWYWLYGFVRRRTAAHLAPLLVPLLPLVAPFFLAFDITPAWGVNLYMALFGVLLLFYGWRQRNFSLLNLGMALLSLLIFLRFCNAGDDFLTYGIVFVILGAGMALGNLAARRIFRQKGGVR